MPRPQIPSVTFSKPTLETRFHIDYEWWKRSNQDLNLYLREHFCDEHRAVFPSDGLASLERNIDWIDPETAVVTRVDPVIYLLLSHCSQMPDYISERTSLVDAVFRALLAASNRPMTPVELARRTGRPADTILKTLSGRVVYKGLRPVSDG